MDEQICNTCERLVRYRESIKPKNASFKSYWNKPVLPYGDKKAWLLIVGLAPGAHGANRTSIPFCGDGAGTLLYNGLFETGLSNKEQFTEPDPLFRLKGVLITNAVRCVPPQNKPSAQEFKNCLSYLQDTLKTETITDILCIGRDSFLQICKILEMNKTGFKHGRSYTFNNYNIHCCYHTSTYNQNTKRISKEELISILSIIKKKKLGGHGG